MKSQFFFLKKLFLFGIALSITASSIDANYGRTFGKSKGIAVVELFTSEGCSSCPKAEKYLAEIISIARQSDEKIFCLSYHVDYWDYLGWKDKNASPEFTKRQIKYGQKFNKQGVFTPQVVINGQESHVGTLRSKIKKSIGQHLGRKKTNTINFDYFREGDNLNVKYYVKAPDKDSRLFFAVVKNYEAVRVSAGENKGETLEHSNVVKKLFKIKAVKNGTVKLSIADLPQTPGYSLVAFYQSLKTLKISAAMQQPLNLEIEYIEENYRDTEDSEADGINNLSA